MKIKLNKNQFEYFKGLEEAKQVGIVYHFVRTTYVLNKVLTENILKSGRDIMFDGKKYPQISLTRDYELRDSITFVGDLWGEVRLTIDGNKLSNRYKIIPFVDLTDYDGSKLERGKGSTESEEAVLSKEIKNIKDYILQIDILKSADINSVMPLLEPTKDINQFIITGTNIKLNVVKKFTPYKK